MGRCAVWEKYAPGIAELLSGYSKFNSRRKPEMLSDNTYSFNYFEWERVTSDYTALAEKAEKIGQHVRIGVLLDGQRRGGMAQEQRHADLVFQRLDLPADRALAQMKFARGGSDALVEGGGLERLQGGGGRQGSAHFMNLAHEVMRSTRRRLRTGSAIRW